MSELWNSSFRWFYVLGVTPDWWLYQNHSVGHKTSSLEGKKVGVSKRHHLVERDNWWFENPEKKLKTEGIKLDWVNDDDKKVEATHCDILNTI